MRENAVALDANKIDHPVLLFHKSQETQVLELVDLGTGAGVSQDAQVEISIVIVEDCLGRLLEVETLSGLEPVLDLIPLAKVKVAEGGRNQRNEDFILENSKTCKAAHVTVDRLNLLEDLIIF